MRQLTIKQKKLLCSVVDNKSIMVLSWDNLPMNVKKELENLGDYETMWSDVSRFLMDYQMSKTYGKPEDFKNKSLKGWK